LSACPGPLPLLVIIPTGKVMPRAKTPIPALLARARGDPRGPALLPGTPASGCEAPRSSRLFEGRSGGGL